MGLKAAAVFLALLSALQAVITLAETVSVEHHLDVELMPSRQRLAGRDRMRIQADPRSDLFFHLSERAEGIRVSVNGMPRAASLSGSQLAVPLEPHERGRTVDIEIRYEAIFHDPVPLNPENTDDPGFGVTASITETGTFLLAGAGWYPELKDSRPVYRLRVTAPQGILAVTAGRSLGHKTEHGATVSEWVIDQPVGGLSLSAGAYEVHEQGTGEIPTALYFFPGSRDLTPASLFRACGSRGPQGGPLREIQLPHLSERPEPGKGILACRGFTGRPCMERIGELRSPQLPI